MFLVARIDALGRIACIEVLIILKSRHALHLGQTFFLGHARIHGALIYDHVTTAYHLSHRMAGSQQGGEVGMIVAVHGCGNSHHIKVAVSYLFQISGAHKTVFADSLLQECIIYLQRGIVPTHERIHSGLVHIKSYRGELGGEQAGKGQSHVAQSYHTDAYIFCLHFLLIDYSS